MQDIITTNLFKATTFGDSILGKIKAVVFILYTGTYGYKRKFFKSNHYSIDRQCNRCVVFWNGSNVECI